jgi:Protein of unknown function (DUF2946).
MDRGAGTAAGARSRDEPHEEPVDPMTWTSRSNADGRSGPAKRRGLLSAVGRHPVARASAVLALFVYVLVGLSPLWVPAAARGGIEICTAYGLQVIPADLPSSDSPADGTKPKVDCPLCRIQAAVLLLPPNGSVPTAGQGVDVPVRLAPVRTSTGQFAGFDHLSRAPPALS